MPKAGKLADAKAAPFPSKWSPELASQADSAPRGKGWLHEIKYDGYRTLVMFDHGKVTLITRNGHDWTKRYGALSKAFAEERPDLILAQGDTTSVLAAALASFYQRIPFGHVEAGLRTGERYSPYPEEKNRVLAGHLAELHFAPTAAARANLLREGIDADTVHVTGNPVIDALLLTASRSLARSVRQEAFIGVLYVVATAATVLVVDRSPQGAEHVKRMLVGSILSVTAEDVLSFIALYSIICVIHWLLRRPLL